MADAKPVPSWNVAKHMEAQGFAGILVPSFFHGANKSHINLVLWDWSDEPPRMVKVHDPTDRLPRNRKSWD